MERSKINARSASLAACSAMAAALLGGFVSHGAYARAEVEANAPGSLDAATLKSIAKAESRVSRSPDRASLRADLAKVYLSAGRFDSAAAAYRDAISLGDDNARSALGLALASIGAGDNAEAMRVLAKWRDKIPASDFGLAVSLAGQPAQGVAILTDVVRGGEDSAKARQNLAYSYALAGQWAQARIIASQDVPGDQLDARISEWARTARPQDHGARVAGLLGTPRGIVDPGQPRAIALDGGLPQPKFARVEAPEAPEAPAAVEASGELPALASAEAARRDDAMTAIPAAMMAEAAMAAPAQAENEDATRFVSRPVVQEVPRASFAQAFQTPAAKPVIKAASSKHEPVRTAQVSALASDDSTHLVQLGSFRTREGAERAWGIFVARNPRLKDHTMRITEAEVRGARYFRVAAEGFDRNSANSMCSSVKSAGRGCLAYAEANPLPGALPSPRSSGAMLARR